MKFLVIAFVAVVGLGFGGAWLITAGGPLDPTHAARPVRAARMELRHGGDRFGAAEARLAALGFGSRPVEAAQEEPVSPADAPATFTAPAEDISSVFRRELTAIEKTDGGLVVWVVDLGQSRGRRAISIGGTYRDGWRVTRIEQQAVELQRKDESRRIALFEELQQP